MTGPSECPPRNNRAEICSSHKPAPALAVEPVPELTVLVLAHAFFGPEIRAWRGEQPLWIVFWGYGVFAGVGLAMLYALSFYLGRIGLQEALLLCMAGYTFWTLVALWRSSGPALNTLWGVLASQIAVA